MIRQVDICQVWTHQFIFIVGRRQQSFVAYLFSLDVGSLACLRYSKIFPTHVDPERYQGALRETFGAFEIPCQFHQKKGLKNCAESDASQNQRGRPVEISQIGRQSPRIVNTLTNHGLVLSPDKRTSESLIVFFCAEGGV